ncbi:MAG: hypothetical protein KC431_28575 [Myxococcales bacterium]|nr:hypothetical protein [Myxococcales bacterium]
MLAVPFLALLLSISPATTEAAPPAGDAAGDAASDAENADYLATKDEVQAAMLKANEDPTEGSASLRNALTKLQNHAPLLAVDAEGQELRTRAQLTLARALMAAEDSDGARDVMDEAIRTARGDPMPTASFGPGLTALHKERMGSLDKLGTGEIAVTCLSPCQVYVNERPATVSGVAGLVPGKYRLHIVDPEGVNRTLQQIIEVTADGTIAIEFGTAPIDPIEPTTTPAFKRMMPRWAEISLMVAGALTMGAGGALIGIHERCPDLSSPLADPQCPEVYLTRTAGIITLAGGGALFLGGTITLAVDEVRLSRSKERQPPAVSLVYTLRF